MVVNITIDMDAKCVECKRPGATQCGLCLRCVTRAMQDKPMKSPQGIAMQARQARIRHGDAVHECAPCDVPADFHEFGACVVCDKYGRCKQILEAKP